MAANSYRERILVAITAKIGELTSISTVRRVRPEFSEFESIPSTQLPLVAVVGQLPNPVQKLSGRTKNQPEKFTSELGIEIMCYAVANVDPDTVVSNLADDLWAKLFEDPTFGDLLLEFRVRPELRIGYWNPYIAFKMDCTAVYIHGTGGI